MWTSIKDGHPESASYISACHINEEAHLSPRTARVADPNRREPRNNTLGTCTSSSVASEPTDNHSPTLNIESDRSPPAKGPAKEMSNFAILSGNIDLNCKNGLLRLDPINT